MTDASRLSVGLKDREIGGVYAPPATNRIISGSLYLVWHDGKLSVERGSGRRIMMEPFGELFEGLDKMDG